MFNLNRAGEKGDIPDRNSRFIKKADYWYYSTREGVDIGPFDTRNAAEFNVYEFVQFMAFSESKNTSILNGHHAA